MYDCTNHDQIICKIQYFENLLNQKVLEKQSLAIGINQPEIKSEIRTKILIYEEILEEYHQIFDDILHKE